MLKNKKKIGASFFVIFCLLIFNIPIVIFTLGADANEPYGELDVLKEVNYEGTWSEGPVEVILGETLEFRITLTYHNTSGLPDEHYAYNISVNDSLPYCLDYVIGSAIPDTVVWNDDPDEYLYWNYGSQKVLDGESIVINYFATVVETTLSAPQENNATVIWNENATGGINLTNSDTATIIAVTNCPPSPPDVNGPTEGAAGETYSFNAMLTDPDDDQMNYVFSWGDGGDTGWLGPVSPGQITQSHTYTLAGTYSVKAKSRDEHGEESEWTSYPWTIVIKNAEVELRLQYLNWLNLAAYVENTCEVDITDIEWEFNISRNVSFNFRDINVDGNGSIPNLSVGEEVIILSDSIDPRIGFVNVTVTVSKTGVVSPKIITARVFLFASMILVLPWTISSG
ncbi:MAG: hypothetical protein BV456_11980 [Thermoplasmata archaeon M8B2D]|nr:MAG: hypothetical protein BV456_11980 [Thermoplasmata archaeon M8B2D]